MSGEKTESSIVGVDLSMTHADDVLAVAGKNEVDMRTAAYVLAIARVAAVHGLRGVYA